MGLQFAKRKCQQWEENAGKRLWVPGEPVGETENEGFLVVSENIQKRPGDIVSLTRGLNTVWTRVYMEGTCHGWGSGRWGQ